MKVEEKGGGSGAFSSSLPLASVCMMMTPLTLLSGLSSAEARVTAINPWGSREGDSPI